jgi:hypothetical protein
MGAAIDDGDRSWDPVYGGRGSGSGRARARFDGLTDCVRRIRDEEFSDEVAVEMIRAAAGNERGLLHSSIRGFMNRDWYGDPLLTHVADLVRAAELGTRVPPLDAVTSQVVRSRCTRPANTNAARAIS